MAINQFNEDVSESNSRLMIKDKELAKLKEDYKRVVKQLREKKQDLDQEQEQVVKVSILIQVKFSKCLTI